MTTSARFFACYLLTPVHAPQRLRCTYVGFTVSPTRRIRQHNGEICNGAKRTSKHRPWEMVAVVHGFPTKFHALQFEYAWQHPYNSRFTKERLCLLKGRVGVGTPRSLKRKLIELHELLQLQPWTHFPLTVSYTSEFAHNIAKSSGFYTWPPHMKCETKALAQFKGVGSQLRSIIEDDAEDDETRGDHDEIRDSDTEQACCFVCEEELHGSESSSQVRFQCYHEECAMQCHTLCLADHFITSVDMMSEGEEEQGEGRAHERITASRPEKGACPNCQGELLWPLLVQQASVRQRTTTGRANTSVSGSCGANMKNTKRRKRDTEVIDTVENGFDTCSQRTREQVHVSSSAGQSSVAKVSSPSWNIMEPGYNDENWFEDHDDDDHSIGADDGDHSFGADENDQDTPMDDDHSSIVTISLDLQIDPFEGHNTDARPRAVLIDLTLDED